MIIGNCISSSRPLFFPCLPTCISNSADAPVSRTHPALFSAPLFCPDTHAAALIPQCMMVPSALFQICPISDKYLKHFFYTFLVKEKSGFILYLFQGPKNFFWSNNFTYLEMYFALFLIKNISLHWTLGECSFWTQLSLKRLYKCVQQVLELKVISRAFRSLQILFWYLLRNQPWGMHKAVFFWGGGGKQNNMS